ncbi:MAG: GDSL-like lipase/acylhydrolase [Proteobacteria bacterium]|nr:GDSL-like lipase/acylhydrolase [Pseudomonadota bacterium]
MKVNDIERRKYRIFHLVSLVVLFALLGDAAAHDRPFSRIVAFGASLTDPGNFYALEPHPELFCAPEDFFDPRTNFPPYDLLSNDPSNFRIPDRPYAKGGKHFTNGPTYVEVLGQRLHLAASTGPAFNTYRHYASNYAVGGARATDFPCRVNLGDQVAAFRSDFRGYAPRDALYVFEIGGNDVRDALDSAAAGRDPTEVITMALEQLGQTAYELYGMGARKFLFLNVPNLGRLPAVRAVDALFPGTSAGAESLTRAYNEGLAGLVAGIGALPGVRFAKVLDVYTKFNDILDHPRRSGFANATDTCVTPNIPPYDCRRPDKYVFWDGIHPTRAVHGIFGEEAAKLVLKRKGHHATLH